MRSFLVTIIFSGFNLAIHTGHKSINNIYIYLFVRRLTQKIFIQQQNKSAVASQVVHNKNNSISLDPGLIKVVFTVQS